MQKPFVKLLVDMVCGYCGKLFASGNRFVGFTPISTNHATKTILRIQEQSSARFTLSHCSVFLFVLLDLIWLHTSMSHRFLALSGDSGWHGDPYVPSRQIYEARLGDRH